MVTFQKPLLPFTAMAHKEERAGIENMKLDSAKEEGQMLLTNGKAEGYEEHKVTPAPHGELMKHHKRVQRAHGTLSGYEHWAG